MKTEIHISNYQAAKRCYDLGLDLKVATKFINANCESSGYIKPDILQKHITKEVTKKNDLLISLMQK
jgi:hypothetical protein